MKQYIPTEQEIKDIFATKDQEKYDRLAFQDRIQFISRMISRRESTNALIAKRQDQENKKRYDLKRGHREAFRSAKGCSCESNLRTMDDFDSEVNF